MVNMSWKLPRNNTCISLAVGNMTGFPHIRENDKFIFQAWKYPEILQNQEISWKKIIHKKKKSPWNVKAHD